MTKITWTTSDDGNKYTATNINGFEIGLVRVKLASHSEWPVLACSANGQTREFATVQSGKNWVEELYTDVADAIENEQ